MSGFYDLYRWIVGWWSSAPAAPVTAARFGTWSDPTRSAEWSDPTRAATWSDS